MRELSVYQGFISYSHTDEAISKRLHKALEAYRVPKRFVGTHGRGDTIESRLGKFFRDRDELPTSADLGEQIERALADSAYMIVLCSPAAAQSRWVNQEIQQFKQLGRAERIFAIIVSGEPNASDIPGREDEECFPPALRFEVEPNGTLGEKRVEPIAADLRPDRDGFDNTKLKVAAGILGVGFDDLKQREIIAERRRRRIAQAIAGTMTVVAVLAIIGGVASYSLLKESQRERSRYLAARALEALEEGWPDRAMLLALESLPLRRGAAFPMPHSIAAVNILPLAESSRRGVSALNTHAEFTNFADYSPDGTNLVTAGDDRTARIWDVQSRSELAVLRGHEDGLTFAQFSPDGTRVLTSSWDETVRLWDRSSGETIAVLEDRTEFIALPQFSTTSDQVLTISQDYTLRIWSAYTGERIMELVGHEGQILNAEFSPDGTQILSASYDGTARVWDVTTGTALWVTEGVPLESARFSPDGTQIIIAAHRQSQILDAANGEVLVTLDATLYRVGPAQFSPDGTVVVTSFGGGAVLVWDALSGQEISVLDVHEDIVRTTNFSPDGTKILTTAGDGTARIWNVSSGTESAVLRGTNYYITSANFSPDGSQIVTAADDGTVRVWDVELPQAELDRVLRGHILGVDSADFSPNTEKIVTSSMDHSVRVWDAENGEELARINSDNNRPFAHFSPDGNLIVTPHRRIAVVSYASSGDEAAILSGHEDWVRSAQFSFDGTQVLTTSSDGTARIWDVQSGEELALLETPGDRIRSANFAPTGARIAAVTNAGILRIWDAETGLEILEIRHPDARLRSADFSPDGRQVLTTDRFGAAKTWDAQTGAEIVTLMGHRGPIEAFQFSPSGATIVTASQDRTARVWDGQTGRQLAVLLGHESAVTSAQFSPNGERIVTTSDVGPARLWDTESGLQLDESPGHRANVNTAQFSSDGTRIVTASADGTARIWVLPDLDDPHLITRACADLARFNRILTREEAADAGITWEPVGPCDRVGVLHPRWWTDAWNGFLTGQSN